VGPKRALCGCGRLSGRIEEDCRASVVTRGRVRGEAISQIRCKVERRR